MDKLRKIWNVFARFTANIGVLLFLIMFLCTIIQVFYRYVLDNPLPWPEEIARYAFIWLAFVGLFHNVREESHYRIDYFFSKLPGVAQVWVDILFNLMILIFLIVSFFGSFSLLDANWHILSANNITVNIIHLSLPLVSVFIVIQILVNLVGKIRRAISH